MLVNGYSKAYAGEICEKPCSTVVLQRKLTTEEKWNLEVAFMTPKQIWSHIVSGEAGALPDGAELVAWTLRSWVVYKEMPPEKAGPGWGWNGWKDTTAISWDAVMEVWDQPMSAAPYAWMREGKFCTLLGNDRDLAYWNSLGWDVEPQFRLEWPEWNLAMNCIWE